MLYYLVLYMQSWLKMPPRCPRWRIIIRNHSKVSRSLLKSWYWGVLVVRVSHVFITESQRIGGSERDAGVGGRWSRWRGGASASACLGWSAEHDNMF